MPRFAIGLAAAALVACGTASVTAEERRPDPTTHDIAACADAPDRPVCLLRVLSSGSSHFSYRNHPTFATARPELLALIEDPANTVEAQLAGGPKDALDAASTIPYLEQRKAVEAVLAADRAGAPPEQALRPIRELARGLPSVSMFFGQIVTASGAQLRADAYESVWQAYTAQDATGQAKPSLALARAALAAWDEHQGDQDEEFTSFYGSGLIEAYALLGDEAGARRAAMRSGEPPAMANVRVLTAFGLLDEAVGAAESLTPRDVPDERGGDNVEATRRRLLLVLFKAERPDLVRRLSLARLESAVRTGQETRNIYADVEEESPLAGLARQDGAASLVPWAERFEAVGRERASGRSLGAARWAVEAWVRAGQPERAGLLVDLWASRVERDLMACNDRPYCVSTGLRLMRLWTGDYGGAHALYPVGVDEIVEFDVVHGRGVRNIDSHVARAKDNPLQVEGALAKCVEASAQRGLWVDADACLDRLVARVDRPLDERERELATRNRASNMSSRYDFPHPRGTAFKATWAAAREAARRGDPSARDRYADQAMRLGGGGPALELVTPATGHIQEVAVSQLRTAGRL